MFVLLELKFSCPDVRTVVCYGRGGYEGVLVSWKLVSAWKPAAIIFKLVTTPAFGIVLRVLWLVDDVDGWTRWCWNIFGFYCHYSSSLLLSHWGLMLALRIVLWIDRMEPQGVVEEAARNTRIGMLVIIYGQPIFI